MSLGKGAGGYVCNVMKGVIGFHESHSVLQSGRGEGSSVTSADGPSPCRCCLSAAGGGGHTQERDAE